MVGGKLYALELENEKLIYTVAGRFMVTVGSTGF